MKTTTLNPIFSDRVTFLQTCAASNGRITDLEVTLMPKGRNALHCHAYAEQFTAIDGDVGIENEKQQQLSHLEEVLRRPLDITPLFGS